MLKERSVLNKVNQECYAILLHHMIYEDDATVAELAEVCGLSPLTVRDLMRVLRRHKVVHICAWEPDRMGRDAFAVFRLGPGRDVPRRRRSRAEVARDYRARTKAQEMQRAAAAQAPQMRQVSL